MILDDWEKWDRIDQRRTDAHRIFRFLTLLFSNPSYCEWFATLTFKSLEKPLWCSHWNKTSLAVSDLVDYLFSIKSIKWSFLWGETITFSCSFLPFNPQLCCARVKLFSFKLSCVYFQEFNGHQFSTTQFSIPTFCEHCGGFIWGLEKGFVCQGKEIPSEI